MRFDLGCNPFSTQTANYLFQVLVIGVGEKMCSEHQPKSSFCYSGPVYRDVERGGRKLPSLFYGDNKMSRVKAYTKCGECGHKADVTAGDEYLCGKCWLEKMKGAHLAPPPLVRSSPFFGPDHSKSISRLSQRPS